MTWAHFFQTHPSSLSRNLSVSGPFPCSEAKAGPRAVEGVPSPATVPARSVGTLRRDPRRRSHKPFRRGGERQRGSAPLWALESGARPAPPPVRAETGPLRPWGLQSFPGGSGDLRDAEAGPGDVGHSPAAGREGRVQDPRANPSGRRHISPPCVGRGPSVPGSASPPHCGPIRHMGNRGPVATGGSPWSTCFQSVSGPSRSRTPPRPWGAGPPGAAAWGDPTEERRGVSPRGGAPQDNRGSRLPTGPWCCFRPIPSAPLCSRLTHSVYERRGAQGGEESLPGVTQLPSGEAHAQARVTPGP